MITENFLIPTLASSLMLGFYDICKKRAVQNNPVAPTLFYSNLCGTVFFIAMLGISGRIAAAANCTTLEWWLIFAKAILVGSSWACVYYAMRELPISIASPVRASAPLWVFIMGLCFYGEIPSLIQAFAMISIFAGYLIFALAGKLENISFARHKGIHALALGTLLGAASAIYDKYLLNTLHISPNVVQFYFAVNLVIVLGANYLICSSVKKENARKFHWHWSVALTGILLIAADFCYFYAVSMPDVHISIISLVRRSNCIVSFALGAFIFREKQLAKKFAALLLILLGVVLLALER
ncbi:MAG: DMT family transporter [Lentisphaerae bacterium]|nr:DMT family transporter [Lentisphaerota bacterium]